MVVPLIAVVTVVAYLSTRPLPPPKVLSYTQITNDGHRKHAVGVDETGIVTDGARLYFTEATPNISPVLAQVSTLGGETVPLPTPFQYSVILDILPSASQLLVMSFSDDPRTNHALWSLPVPGGSPRHLGDLKSLVAGWSPDGKTIAYAKGSDRCLARSDGTESRKIATVPGIPGWVVSWIPGLIRWSPDGHRLRLSVQDPRSLAYSIWEARSDGTNLHALLPDWNSPPAECCGNWTADGKYNVFQSTRNGRTDLWAIREKFGLLERSSPLPVQLTAGPMNFLGPVPSRDGRKLFALGVQSKVELDRYNPKSKQFEPYLPAISAEALDFSRDGQWVSYVAFPQRTLWRSKADGSDRLQLTFTPMQAASPRWSPNGYRSLSRAKRRATSPKSIWCRPRVVALRNWSQMGKMKPSLVGRPMVIRSCSAGFLPLWGPEFQATSPSALWTFEAAAFPPWPVRRGFTLPSGLRKDVTSPRLKKTSRWSLTLQRRGGLKSPRRMGATWAGRTMDGTSISGIKTRFIAPAPRTARSNR